MSDDFKTASGIPLKAIYTPEDISGHDYERDLGAPGEPPYTRGSYPLMYRSQPWRIKQLHGYKSVEEINRRFKLALDRGQNRLSYVMDNPSLYGLDADDEAVQPADIGFMGIPINSVQDFKNLLSGIPLDDTFVEALQCVQFQAPYLALFMTAYEQLGFDKKLARGSCHNDLVLPYVASTIFKPLPPHATLRLVGDMVEWCAENTPRWVVLGTMPGYNARECGVTAYEELAIGMVNAISQIDEVLRRGKLKIDDFVHMIGFHLSSDRDFFEEIAKFRAARRMWSKLILERYKAQNPKSAKFKFHVQTAGSSLTYQQPLNNIPRVTYQILAAALGGAQSINSASYLEAMTVPTEESELVAIRSQQVLQHESNITSVIDPLGGSYYVEWLTSELERRAWEYVEKIESHGGLIKTIETGWIHNEFGNRMRGNEASMASGDKKVIGVNIFKMDDEPYFVHPQETDHSTYYVQKDRLAKLRSERDNSKVRQALEKIRNTLQGEENVMPAFSEAARADATLGEICGVLRETYGIWRYPLPIYS